MMQLLGSSDEVAFDRIYAFEHAYLSYLLQWSRIPERGKPETDHWNRTKMEKPRLAQLFGVVGGLPWGERELLADEELWPVALRQIWLAFSRVAATAHEQRHGVAPRYYAEKSPVWVSRELRGVLATRRIHLVRDPRDQWLSIMAFNKQRGTRRFGVRAVDTPEGFAARFADRQRRVLRTALAERNRPQARLVHYEQLILTPDRVVDELGGWLQLHLAPDRLSTQAEHYRHHMTASDAQASVARWQRELPGRLRRIFDDALGDELAALGYPAGTSSPEPGVEDHRFSWWDPALDATGPRRLALDLAARRRRSRAERDHATLRAVLDRGRRRIGGDSSG